MLEIPALFGYGILHRHTRHSRSLSKLRVRSQRHRHRFDPADLGRRSPDPERTPPPIRCHQVWGLNVLIFFDADHRPKTRCDQTLYLIDIGLQCDRPASERDDQLPALGLLQIGACAAKAVGAILCTSHLRRLPCLAQPSQTRYTVKDPFAVRLKSSAIQAASQERA